MLAGCHDLKNKIGQTRMTKLDIGVSWMTVSDLELNDWPMLHLSTLIQTFLFSVEV